MTGITDMVVVIKLRNKEGIIVKGREGRKEGRKEREEGWSVALSFILHYFLFF